MMNQSGMGKPQIGGLLGALGRAGPQFGGGGGQAPMGMSMGQGIPQQQSFGGGMSPMQMLQSQGFFPGGPGQGNPQQAQAMLQRGGFNVGYPRPMQAQAGQFPGYNSFGLQRPTGF